MKRVLPLIIILLLCILILSGCGISEKMRNKIISRLQDEKIISSNWELKDTILAMNHSTVPGPVGYYYIYTDSYNKLHAIEIHVKFIEDKNEYYYVYIYDDVLVDESQGKVLEENETAYTTYKYNDGIVRDGNIYLLKNGKKYYINIKNILGIKFYDVVEE